MIWSLALRSPSTVVTVSEEFVTNTSPSPLVFVVLYVAFEAVREYALIVHLPEILSTWPPAHTMVFPDCTLLVAGTLYEV